QEQSDADTRNSSPRSHGEVSLLLRFLLRRFFGGPFLLGASAGEGVVQAVVSFVARVLEYRTFVLLPRYFRGPGPRPRRRILDRELIAERRLVEAGEALRQAHVLTRALEGELVGEVRGFDHQGLAVPTTA